MMTDGSATGSSIGRYRIGQRLGAGAMGEVYEARAPDGTDLAIKLLHLGAAGPEAQKRFRREALLCATMKHPNIVDVSDHGFHDGSPFFVMRRLAGHDLERTLESTGALRPDVAVAVMMQVCAGVRHAHEAGIIHRDLKPANVFLDQRGEELTAIVCDFGVAKVFDEDGALTASGAVLGTPLYMAPEQLLDSKRVDTRCDVWALGMMLYTALAGTPALQHVKSFSDLLLALNQVAIPPLQDRAPWVPPALARIVHAALLPIDRRITTVHELETALVRWAPGARTVMRADLVPLSEARRNQVAVRATLPTDSSELGTQGEDTVAGVHPSDPAMRDTNVGRTLGSRYRITTKIGSGGMGAVYEAVDTAAGSESRTVAVKIMQHDASPKSGESTRRFLREAKASARMRARTSPGSSTPRSTRRRDCRSS